MSKPNGVLIIDDDEDDCRMVEESLHQVGIRERIEYRLSAEEGLEFLEEQRERLPKLVIIDMNMPLMNGTTGLKKIVERYSIKVIMHTTYCTDELVKEVKLFGGLDCVKKGTSYADNLRFAKRVSELLKATR